MALRNQLVLSAAMSYLAAIVGIGLTWPSFMVELLSSEATPLTRRMGPLDVSLVGALSSVGGLLSTPLYGYLLDRVGRKRCALLCALPCVATWCVIAVTRSVEAVLCALFVSGLGGGGIMICMVFVSEVAESRVRGALSSGPLCGYALGMLVAYALGGYLSYYTVVYAQLALTALYFPVLYLVRESPVYLLQLGDDQGAAQSVAHYRCLPADSKRVLEELYEIKRTLNPEADSGDDELTPEQEKLQVDLAPAAASQRLSAWKFFCRSRSSRRALLVCLALMVSSIFMGLVAIMVYADSLFRRAAPGLSSAVCSMMLALCLMAASLLAAFVSDRSGRKVLMMWSSVGCGVCSLLLASQMQLSWGPDWLAMPIILLFTFLYNIGAGTVPYVLIGEVFLPEVRSGCSMLVMESAWLLNFALLFTFNPLVETIGLHNVFYLFSGVCWATVLFCWFFLPETKGLSTDEMQTLFAPPKRRRTKLQLT